MTRGAPRAGRRVSVAGARARARARAGVAAAAAFALTLTLGACTPSDGDTESSPAPSATARPVTQAEADRLAVARFNVYDERYVDLTASIPVEGQVLELDGTADMQAHEAYAQVTTGDDPPQHALLQWTQAGKALVPLAEDDPAVDGSTLPDPPPADGWQPAALVPEDPLDAILAVILSLASDRPENAQLLLQNGAEWVGTETYDDVEADVFTAPGSDGTNTGAIRYSVDERGVLHHVTADVGRDDLVEISLTPAEDPAEIPLIPALG
ncbi:hypothetical protein GCM10025865_13370 [Paraoerskovia sediminicola]|uniref:LppX_LprAFG lipoprotein n=1 Tax=Paraoerskovia sediminicola TaxID=1138587 RepID=A0ABM8G1X5_9CELL|nr:hypothetical protein [Paraoerskovia sediminicola]BDZ42038.1 hypothetical protein GCM10025865_13370 [Paraoerskovia sediminicola]